MKRVGLATVSQVLSSASNFLLTLFLARSLSLEAFGQVSFALAAITLTIALSRATIGQLVVLSDESSREVGYIGCQYVVAALAAVISSLIAIFVVRDIGLAIVVGIACAGALIADGYRYIAVARVRWIIAVAGDGVWVGVLVAGIVTLQLANLASATSLISVWAAGAVCSAAVSLVILHRGAGVPRLSLRTSQRWSSAEKQRLLPLAGEASLVLVAGYAVNIVAATFATFTGLGILRSAQVLMTPIATVGQAFSLVIVQSVTSRARSGKSGLQGALYLGGILALGLVAWTTILILPEVGSLLLQDNWAALSPLLLVLAFGQFCSIVTLTLAAWMRAAVSTATALRLRALVFWIDPVVIGISSLTLGSVGPALGMVVAQGAQSLVAIAYAARLIRRPG